MKPDIDHLELDHIFRHSYGKIVAALTNRFGLDSIENIEDAVQEALIKGMQIWSFRQMPKDPTGWLLAVAKNKLIDSLRRDRRIFELSKENNLISSSKDISDIPLSHQIVDDQLRMIFACCHPKLSQQQQIILTLKLVAGFHNKEVARALVKNEESVAKAFTRAKKKFRNEIPSLAIPIELGLRSRLNIVLKIIYLIFTEGYSASQGAAVIKRDLCYEAIRLALLLNKNKLTEVPNLKALIALMCFHAARFEARIDASGKFVDLEHQDRNLWDQTLINLGRSYLSEATGGSEQPSSYLFEAFISFYHCTAVDFASTDWVSILSLYDLQMKHQYTPLTELNRIIPYAQVYGSKKALDRLSDYADKDHAVKNGLFYAVKARLLADLNEKEEAVSNYNQAIRLTQNFIERTHLISLRDAL